MEIGEWGVAVEEEVEYTIPWHNLMETIGGHLTYPGCDTRPHLDSGWRVHSRDSSPSVQRSSLTRDEMRNA